MEHNFIDLDQFDGVNSLQIFEHSNNIDKHDNLDELPCEKAVFAVCGRVNGLPANARLVGYTDNLRQHIRSLFLETGPFENEYIKAFMLSIKTKHLLYMTLLEANNQTLKQIADSWDDQLLPKCEEAMNEVF